MDPSLTFPRRVTAELEVRPARVEDFDAVLTLLGQLHENESAAGETDRQRDVFEEIVRSPQRVLLVGVYAGAVAGTLDLIVVSNLTHGGRPWAAIENLVVNASDRRRGIGGALMEAAVDIARARGCYKLQLVSHERRSDAHDLYRRTGFDAPVQGYRRYLDEGRPDGR